jgi:glycine cleavage system H protein
MEIFYTNDHEWVKIEGNAGTIGITGYATDQLGDITFIDLPQVGSIINQGDILCEIESVKAASDIYVPLTGTIKEVNETLESSPGTINSSPENEGWIVKIELSKPEETHILLSKTQYEEYLKTLV